MGVRKPTYQKMVDGTPGPNNLKVAHFASPYRFDKQLYSLKDLG